MTSSYDFTDKDYFVNIVRFLDGYCELKKLSGINKSSNAFIKRETNFKDIVRAKRNKYNCDMLKSYLIKKFRYELDNDYKKILNKVRKSVNNFRSLTDKESLYMTYKINACIYTNSMNKKCLPYLEDIISYYFQEKNKRDLGLNNYTQKISISISKILYNIILSFDNNYRLKNKNIELWIS
jgi:hypothetical protein